MQQTRAVELGTGLFILLGMSALFFLVTQTSSLNNLVGEGGYRVTARFDNVGGLSVRAPVSLAGVTIGRVEEIDMDPERLNAVVTLRIDSRYDQIPEDTFASIFTSGLLGGQYIGLSPGGMDSYMVEGSEFEFTEDAIVLENLIGKYLIGGGDE